MFMNGRSRGVFNSRRALGMLGAYLAILSIFTAFLQRANAQDDRDDPPGRVARLGYMEGSVSFQPAGENDWVGAVPNRPMTTGDKLWADRDSRAEIQLGSSMIDLGPNTGFSFLNLDDRTVQVQLNSGSINIRVWNLDRDNVFEIDTANQAFTMYQPGRYRVDASEDGSYTVVTIREGEGESTGNGQSYTLHAGQRTTFRGTTSLNAEVEPIGGSDDFDGWASSRERRYDDSPSARYCSRRVVGFEDLDDYGSWQPTPDYGYAWFPNVNPGWAPYHDGHWAWIDPWGWTWVDDARWGYAPFHYGRWFSYGGRWGWIPGPREERPVYAPALVAFVGGGAVVGATVAWFPLGPREVYVPSYRVSPAYVNRVNVTNTTVNVTQVTNVYNTTIVNNNTTINNVTYVNQNVRGGVTAMPQHAFASAQPVARTAVAVNQQDFARRPVLTRAAVPPAREAVLGNVNTANRVAAPPQAVISRPVIAKAAPPPPAASFAARQQMLQEHPGQPINRVQMQQLRPASAPAPLVRQAPPARPATATPMMARPTNQPAANQPQPNQPSANQPANRGNARPFEPPARNDRPPVAQPNNQPQPNFNRPENNQPAPNNRPQPNNSTPQPDYRSQPNQPRVNPPASDNRPAQPEMNRPQQNNPTPPPARNDRPPATQPNYRPPDQPRNDRPQNPPPQQQRPEARAPEPQQHPQQARPMTPEEKKRQDEQKKNQKPQ